MPLRDHFRPPLDTMRHWEGLHGGWPMMIVAGLRRRLPRRYFAEPHIHSGSSAEIDVATFENEDDAPSASGEGNDNGGGVATATWAPPQAKLAVATDLPAQDVFEVRVFDEKRAVGSWPLSKSSARRTRTAPSTADGSSPSAPACSASASASSS